MANYLMFLGFFLASCSGLQSKYHRVAEGDSLTTIAGRYDIPERTLVSYNESKLKNGLKPGVKLYIPHNHFARGIVKSDVRRAALPSATKADFSPVFLWPIQGVVSSPFGRRGHKHHEGIDIAAPSGTPIHASRSGHVIYASQQISGYGNMVILKHADSYSTVYAHLSRIMVTKGQFVGRNQVLGLVGRTGKATRPHLHFEVRNHTLPQDPLLYLQGQFAANRMRSR